MNIKSLLPGAGVVLFIAGTLIGTIFGEAAKPGERAGDAAENVVPALAAHEYCHNGWKADEVRTQGIVSYTCERGGVTVILDTTGRFNIASFPDGRFVLDESQVPGW